LPLANSPTIWKSNRPKCARTLVFYRYSLIKQLIPFSSHSLKFSPCPRDHSSLPISPQRNLHNIYFFCLSLVDIPGMPRNTSQIVAAQALASSNVLAALLLSARYVQLSCMMCPLAPLPHIRSSECSLLV
jgi:hypothetical protein